MTADPVPVAVVGAGPYGLACAAHLRAAGVEPWVAGEPMSSWERHMPAGMLLRSSWRASWISSPGGRLSLRAFEHDRGRELARPVPLEDYLVYGRWFQERAAPAVDRRRVRAIHRDGDGGFALELEDGGAVAARRVVLAAGVGRFAHRPPAFAELPPELATHTADHADLGVLAGRRVLVVGAGQSAVESAALARERGADVRLLVRHPVRWLERSARLHGGGRVTPARALYAPHDVGPALLSWVVAAPGLVRHAPAALRARMTARCVRPAVADWVAPRLSGVDVVVGRPAGARRTPDGAIEVALHDGRVVGADHVLLGTGFRADLGRLGLLAPELAGAVRTVGGSPVLGPGLETSVAGLHVVGALAAHSFGPVMRFVCGTWHAAPAVAHAVRQRGARMPTAGAGTSRIATGGAA